MNWSDNLSDKKPKQSKIWFDDVDPEDLVDEGTGERTEAERQEICLVTKDASNK